MDHETIVQLLPWYVNGTLPPHERAAVESELASCPLCARELAELQRVHAAMHEIDVDAPGPSESLFGRTLARIDSQPQTTPRAFSLRDWWRQLSSLGKVAALVPAALAIALVVVAVRFSSGPMYKPTAINAPVATDEVVQTGVAGRPYPVPAEQAKSLGAVTTRSATANVYSVNAQAAPPPNAPARDAELHSKIAAIPVPTFGGRVLQRPQLIRTGSMSLLVPDVERAVAQLTALAQLQFGDVISLDDETPSQPGVRHTAQVQLSVPADRFDETMAALAKIGAAQSRSINAENVSDQIVDAQARLRNLRHTEADMLRILDRSGKIPDVLDVTQQIAQVREQIEQLDAQLQSMQHRVSYSTISVAIEDEKAVASAEPSFGTQLSDAWTSATRSVRNVSLKLASVVLLLVAFAPYWLAITVIALLIANRLRNKV
jgi:anti-sigma factor RsiW